MRHIVQDCRCLASVLRHIYRTVVDAIDELSGVSIETHIQHSCLAPVLRHIYRNVFDAIDELSGVSIETLYIIVVDAVDEFSGVSIETHIQDCH